MKLEVMVLPPGHELAGRYVWCFVSAAGKVIAKSVSSWDSAKKAQAAAARTRLAVTREVVKALIRVCALPENSLARLQRTGW